VARHEEGVVRGLHVVPESGDVDEVAIQAIQDRFAWRLGEVGLHGRFVVEYGDVPRTVCDRARWNDLVVMPLTHPPGPRVMERLSSGIRTIVQRCPRPLLAVPGEPSPMRRALLAYNGSPTADEALYITTYLAARWESTVVVLTVHDASQDLQEPLGRVRAYLQAHGIDADFEVRDGDLADNVLTLAAEYGCDYVVMGSYGRQPVVELVLGSGLNDVLRVADIPIFVGR
jgi:nucleotide-binding universal stress UspA family protein